MFRPTTASSLSSVRAAAITEKNQGGALTTLGAKSWLDGQSVDQTLLWIDAAGALKGGPSYGPHAAATDVEVKLLADTGPMGIRYISTINAGAATLRGDVLQLNPGAVGKGAVQNTGLPGRGVAGVALFNIAIGEVAWIVTEGLVMASVLATGALSAGDLLYSNATGDLTDTASGAPQGELVTAIGGASTVIVMVRLYGTF